MHASTFPCHFLPLLLNRSLSGGLNLGLNFHHSLSLSLYLNHNLNDNLSLNLNVSTSLFIWSTATNLNSQPNIQPTAYVSTIISAWIFSFHHNLCKVPRH